MYRLLRNKENSQHPNQFIFGKFLNNKNDKNNLLIFEIQKPKLLLIRKHQSKVQSIKLVDQKNIHE